MQLTIEHKVNKKLHNLDFNHENLSSRIYPVHLDEIDPITVFINFLDIIVAHKCDIIFVFYPEARLVLR